MIKIVFLFLLCICHALAPLEQPDGATVYFGAWYNRKGGDTPTCLQERFNHKPLSLWQSDMDLNATLDTAQVNNFMDQVDELHTDAIYQGLNITDTALGQLVQVIKRVLDRGGRIMIRYASEMNGSWFSYGQQPESFKASWIHVVSTVRAAVNGSENLAFVWAPNSAAGYPFPAETYSATNKSAEFKYLDTNGDGLYDSKDDPYSPFYPGDEYVDWVGFSMYHYGNAWTAPLGWTTNDIPAVGKVESMLNGENGYGGLGNFSMYRMFCGDGWGGQPKSLSSGGKPFLITESGATFHILGYNADGSTFIPAPGAGRAAIKQAWWRQMLDPGFLAKYPKLKAICTFDFIKSEESTWRDFTWFGDTGTNLGPPGMANVGQLDAPVLDVLRSDLAGIYGPTIIWANSTGNATAKCVPPPPHNSNGSPSHQASLVLVATCLTFFLFL